MLKVYSTETQNKATTIAKKSKFCLLFFEWFIAIKLREQYKSRVDGYEQKGGEW